MKRIIPRLLCASVLALSLAPALADEAKPYVEGAVLDVTAVRTKPGMFDAYMKWLSTTYKQLMDEEKKTGIILDYAIYTATPRTPHDPDLYLITVVKNYAAFDGMDDRVEAVQKRMGMNRDQANKGAVDREALREIIGDQMIQELKLK